MYIYIYIYSIHCYAKDFQFRDKKPIKCEIRFHYLLKYVPMLS